MMNNKQLKKHYRGIHKKILASQINKMGYPNSLLGNLYGKFTDTGIEVADHHKGVKFVDNTVFGIKQLSLAEIFITNVGDPFVDSNISQPEVKDIEREIINLMGKFYGLASDVCRGYVTSGGTESNFICLWWSKRYLINQSQQRLLDLQEISIKKHQLLDEKLKWYQADNASFLLEQQKTVLAEEIMHLVIECSAIKERLFQLSHPVIFYTEQYTHYSISKIADQISLITKTVKSNTDGSMDINDFKVKLLEHIKERSFASVIININVGTTVTGATDDLLTIKYLLDEYLKPEQYTIHIDGALNGFVMPIVKPFGEIKNYFDDIGVNTIAISSHKFLGTVISGMALSKKTFIEKAFQNNSRIIEYIGNISDITFSGCRSGLNILLLHNALHSLYLDKDSSFLQKLVNQNLENAEYLYNKLVELLGANHVMWLPRQFNILFLRPSDSLMNKYRLMPAPNQQCVICVLMNVTKKLIDQFINDYSQDRITITEPSGDRSTIS